ncbi:MAG: type II toxin-antitoxin system VapC family toxin [Saprospiraceae bacterium]|jgi:predicted nucleic acid-binding protein
MSGIKAGLLDTNILIYRSKGLLDFRALSSRYDNLYVSAITWMEALGFNFSNPQEQAGIEAILNAIQVVHTDMDIVKQVISYRQTRKIKIPDAIILATAKKLDAELVTTNDADFKGIDTGVSIFVPTLISSI